MAARYDVLLTNYRPGVLDRLGLGFEELHRINPGWCMRRQFVGPLGRG